MTNHWRLATALLAAALLGGCDAPTEPTELEVDLSASPDPAAAAVAGDASYKVEGDDDEPDEVRTYPWKTSFVVTLQETAGTALDITSVTLRVQQATGGIVIAPSGGEVEHYQFNSSASGNRLAANGRATVGFEVWYDLPNKGREALVTVSFGFREVDQGDDNAFDTFADSIEVKVAP
jgi:hypothetical protein